MAGGVLQARPMAVASSSSSSALPPVKSHLRAAILLLAAHLGVCLAFFVAMPLQSLYLAQRFALGEGPIGGILGVFPLIFAVLGFWTGGLADRYGRNRFCALGLVGFCAAYGLLAAASWPWQVVLAGALFGVAKACFEPAYRAQLLAVTPEPRKSLVLKLRYINYCLGASLGPGIGAWLFARGATQPFMAAAGLLGTLMLSIPLLLRQSEEPQVGGRTAPAQRFSLGLLRRDPALGWVTLGGFLIFGGFSLFESMLPLVLRAHSPGPEALFAKLLTLNALCAMGLQWPLERFAGQQRPQALVLRGCAALALGLICFGLGRFGVGGFVVGTVLFAAGEASIYANMELLIDRMAPRAEVATYFGVSDLRYFGFAAGPWLGGAVLEHAGSTALFCGAAAFLGVAAAALVFCDRALRRGDPAATAAGRAERLAG